MNEMYDMSIVTHYYSVIGILVVIGMNAIMLANAKDIAHYQRQMSIFTPLSSMALGGIIFTGVVMMAAKHLDFSIENILMIVFSLVIIVLEVKRIKTLKYLKKSDNTLLVAYKRMAFSMLALELLTTLSISVWMWI
ncbi:MAG: hypothetical protein Q9M32_03215 [Sulfurimonas sp.]|nr:hypothetical protein [Sulfurimonas sp.]